MASIKKNLAYNMFYQILAIILPFITAPYVSRVLGAEGVGIYSYTYSIANYFLLFIMLGITNHGNRSIASTKKEKKALSKCFWNNYIVQLFMGIIVAGIYMGYCTWIVKENKIYALIQMLVVLSGILDINWVFWGMEEFKLTVVRNTICKVLSVVCIFVFVKEKQDLWKYVLIMAVTIFSSQLVLWKFLFDKISFFIPKWENVKKNIKPIVILFLPVLAYSLYRIMDKIMIGNFSTMQEVGYYDNAEKILNIPIGIVTALGNVMLPRISNLLSEGKKKEQEKYMKTSFVFVSIVEGVICFGISSVANIFATFYYGSGFVKTGEILAIVIYTALISGWANIIRTQYLIPMKEDNIYVISMISAAVVNFGLNLMFIPKYGAKGALVGTVLAELTVLIVQAIAVRKIFNWKDIIKENIPYIFIGIVMLGAVKIENVILNFSQFENLIIEIFSGGILYLALLIVWCRVKNNFIYRYILKLAKNNRM